MSKLSETPMTETKVYKDMRSQWTALTYIPLVGMHHLRVATHKVSGGEVVTTASAVKIENGFETHMLYGDFSKRLERHKMRCTENNVINQHLSALEKAVELVETVSAQYA